MVNFMELDLETKGELFEITEDLLVLYTEEKVLMHKIPTRRQLLVEMESKIINFISLCAFALGYTEEKITAYFNEMRSVTERMSTEIIDRIEFELQ